MKGYLYRLFLLQWLNELTNLKSDEKCTVRNQTIYKSDINVLFHISYSHTADNFVLLDSDVGSSPVAEASEDKLGLI